ncbi:hypothetical protein ACR3S4_02610 [Streptomyces sp. CH8.1]|uniref:hypothetical protein n=1 Tax=Streptomyces sp. CH8.1 TaxID=3439546 RepID=UPI003DA0C5D8
MVGGGLGLRRGAGQRRDGRIGAGDFHAGRKRVASSGGCVQRQGTPGLGVPVHELV